MSCRLPPPYEATDQRKKGGKGGRKEKRRRKRKYGNSNGESHFSHSLQKKYYVGVSDVPRNGSFPVVQSDMKH